MIMKVQVYSVEINNKIIWNYTLSIDVDLGYWYSKSIDNLFVIDSFFSIGYAESLVNYLNKQPYCDLKKKFMKLEYSCMLMKTTDDFCIYIQKYKQWKEEVHQALQGRIILFEELKLIQQSIEVVDLDEIINIQNIQLGYLHNEIDLTASIIYPYNIAKNTRVKNIKCRRCGSSKNIVIGYCERCKDICATCENCIQLGRSKSCSPLLNFNFEEELNNRGFTIDVKQIELNDFQKQISEKTIQFLSDKEKKELLIWAVTGAGKTEMTFPVIASALNKGYKVLFTAPRKDVVIDLIPRFKKVFLNFPIVCLYGGSIEKWSNGLLYIATTHQTIRFADYFDLIILDEMDAYPYENNNNLQFSVKRSLKSDGQMIMMTATPSKEWIEKVNQCKTESVILPLRYNQKPLPIPDIKIIPSKQKLIKHKNPYKIIDEFIKNVKTRHGQAFIFVSSIREVSSWTESLNRWYDNEKFVGVDSSDSDRDNKIQQFKQGRYSFLVTTTILERGVTVPNLHVMVIGADSRIFTESTLVQIAGRVGRDSQISTGIIWFLAENMTNDMIKAKNQIKRLNNIANKLSKYRTHI